MIASPRILIVDDSPEDCATYRRHLERAGQNRFQIVAVHSLQEGLIQCREAQIDCILLDFSMPDGDGLEFLTQLRSEQGENGPPVIMLTGHGNEAVAVQAMKLGAQDYLVKDLTADSLRRAVHSAMDCMSLRREVEDKQSELTRLYETQKGLLKELEKKAAELSEADRRKNEFLAVLAHELRNPLGPIRNAAHIMQLTNSSPSAEAETARNIIDRQIGHMSRLIEDLLDVSRIVRGKCRLRKDDIELGKVIRSTVGDHQISLEDAGLTLTLDLPDTEIWVNADPTRISQVVGNLLDNSGKFTPTGGSVTVSLGTSSAGNLARIQVTDSGEGVDPDTLEHMFDIFSQSDRSLDHSRGGLGIGLSIVKGIVELHGGNVSAASNGLGQGCEISIALPLLPSAPKENLPVTSNATELRSLNILVVEDNRDAALSMKMLLETLGHKVAVELTGQTAIELARNFRPDLVLCDIGLADGMTGYMVAKKFREDPLLASTYLVALTGYGRSEDQQRASEAGFDLHLTKPVALEILRSLPERLCKA